MTGRPYNYDDEPRPPDRRPLWTPDRWDWVALFIIAAATAHIFISLLIHHY